MPNALNLEDVMELVKRTHSAEVRVEPIEYNGQKRIDVRLWVWAKEQEQMIPTKRGVGLRLDQLEAFRRDLVDAESILAA